MPRHQQHCRYYANGICSRGQACQFLHDAAKRNEDICQFNLAGKCSFGQTCRFHHTRPRNEEQRGAGSSSASTSTPGTPIRVRPVQLEAPPPPKAQFNVAAAVFVPRWKDFSKPPPPLPRSYASAAAAASSGPSGASCSYSGAVSSGSANVMNAVQMASLQLCPYYQRNGECYRKDTDCPFAHGDHCDMCNMWSLHPFNEEVRRKHQAECLNAHTQEMERAFILQKTESKTCGICMENIMEKNLRFGILNNCQHCFCLDCIRQWRCRDQESIELATKTVRSCPECRQHSDYVIPSMFWVEAGVEKNLLIQMYKENMKDKVCKYYSDSKSRGDCPFGNKCFYKHQLPDGSIDPGESPHQRRRVRLADYLFDTDSDGEEDYESDDSIGSWEGRYQNAFEAMLMEVFQSPIRPPSPPSPSAVPPPFLITEDDVMSRLEENIRNAVLERETIARRRHEAAAAAAAAEAANNARQAQDEQR